MLRKILKGIVLIGVRRHMHYIYVHMYVFLYITTTPIIYSLPNSEMLIVVLLCHVLTGMYMLHTLTPYVLVFL